jgi:hypothetical protein
VDGVVWTLKGVPGILTDFHYRIDLHEQRGSFPNFVQPDQRATFQAARVAIEAPDGRVVEELLEPGVQLILLSVCNMDVHMTTPFCFTMPGFAAEELDPWQQGNETWRRLKVTFPDYLARHAREQIYYFGSDGLLRRHDYVAKAVTKERTATHYMTDSREFAGFTIATKQRAYVRNPDGGYSPEPLLVSLDVEEVAFS